MTDVPLSRSARRLAEEMEDHGVALAEADGLRHVLLDELDYALRVPMFEGRRPIYGSFSMPLGSEIRGASGLVDLVALDGMPREVARTFADGRSAFLVNHQDRPHELACFDRPIQYEAELVVLQQVTGARIVQRTPVLGQVRLFTDRCVVSWDGQRWTDRPTAAALLPSLLESAPDLDPEVARGLLEVGVHWLSPARVGATIVVHDSDPPWSSMDVSTKLRAPRLSLRARHHYPALFASLQQHDLATLVSAAGDVEYLGVGLRSSEEAERRTPRDHRGMRHRSAQRFSYDHPSTTIAVVSENGPVTVFRGGQTIALRPATDGPEVQPSPAPSEPSR